MTDERVSFPRWMVTLAGQAQVPALFVQVLEAGQPLLAHAGLVEQFLPSIMLTCGAGGGQALQEVALQMRRMLAPGSPVYIRGLAIRLLNALQAYSRAPGVLPAGLRGQVQSEVLQKVPRVDWGLACAGVREYEEAIYHLERYLAE
jgi:hypothetical protein